MIAFGKTDRGLCREVNQDCFACQKLEDGLLYAVLCDGMGGENGGNVASSLTVRDLSRELSAQLRHAAPDEDLRPLMEAAIRHANALVNRASRDTAALRGMGTTLVLAVARGNRVTLAHAGDSRAYLVEGETLTLRGMDVTAEGEPVFDSITGPRTKAEALGSALAGRIREGRT